MNDEIFAEVQLVPVASLACDIQNPRIVETVDSPRAAIRAIFRASMKEQLELAEDIAKHGLMPFMMLYVAEARDGLYVVLEGNRRTAALKALHNPDIVGDILTPNTVTVFAKHPKVRRYLCRCNALWVLTAPRLICGSSVATRQVKVERA